MGAAICCLSLGCGSQPPPPGPVPTIQDDSSLGAGDVFDVSVFGEENLTGTHRVAPDGSIDFPLVGRLEVAGLETNAVADLIRTRLHDGEFLQNPQVSVRLLEANSRRISVVGAVQRPGTFPMTPGLTVVQAVSLAGGFTAMASADETLVTRRGEDGVQRLPVPVRSVIEGRRADVFLQAGDIIYVPERVF